MTRQLVEPLAALSRAAWRLAHGDSTASLPRAGASEIEALVDSFGEMRDKLAARAAERERLLAAVQESETHFHSVLDSSLDVIYRANLQTGQFEYISPSAEAVVG